MVIMALPQQSSDELTGHFKVEGFVHVLRDLPEPQIDFMIDEVLRTCEWLPSPAKTLKIANNWKRVDEPAQARAIAAHKARDERQARLDDDRAALLGGPVTQDWVDALPERHAEILETEGFLYRCRECGSHTQRRSAIRKAISSDAAVRTALDMAEKSKTDQRQGEAA